MNYADFIQRHRDAKADITLSVVPVDERRASDFGLMKIDNTAACASFSEKPKGEALKAMAVDTTLSACPKEKAKELPYIASMGIYVFEKQVLLDLLNENPTHTDFGKEIIPAVAVRSQCSGLSVQGLLGRYRHHRVVLPRQSGAHRAAGPPPSVSTMKKRRSTPARATCRRPSCSTRG